MDELEPTWSAAEEWHPMFRAYMGEIRYRFRRIGWSDIYSSWMDYADYWEQENDRRRVPDVWR